MDPYTPSAIGLVDDGRRISADTVIVSSLTDVAHANVGLIEGEPQVINALDVARAARKVRRSTAPPCGRSKQPRSPTIPDGADDNALYAFNAGGLWFLHMGDLGYGLNEDDLAPFAGRCDVLLALTGEGLTLKLDELDPMIEILNPTWIVPMHYNLAPVSGQKRRMTKVDVFIERRPLRPRRLCTSTGRDLSSPRVRTWTAGDCYP